MTNNKECTIIRRMATGSFWIIMAIHVVVFTSIGLFTPRGWSLLLLFLGCMAALVLVFGGAKAIARRNPDKKWAQNLLRFINFGKANK